ncbi:hypothetical protein [Nannocystis bainbridge]|uniref:Uncharacterized protein n=1 Tax=Nannocystis bainbridge TaxID=2995303 RepID=A0ABT5E2I4_9BACT|nr:hypothetical protein [Nannocystis bainbridge]MDC0720089.1 hypothetical protein [Nannocystis bainbridge]
MAAVVAILYALVGIYAGLAQQDIVARPATVVCEYRVDLLRDRLVAQFDQRPQQWAEDDANAAADLSNLLRETQALCAGSDTDLGRRIERLIALQRDFAERGRRHADARRELLAL